VILHRCENISTLVQKALRRFVGLNGRVVAERKKKEFKKMETGNSASLHENMSKTERETTTARYKEPLIIIAILLLCTLMMVLADADRKIAGLVLDYNGQWLTKDSNPWEFIYDYAFFPGFFIMGFALFLLLASLVGESLKKYRRQAMFTILLLLLGPGFVVNIALKDNLGRARPSEIKEFGGKHEFTQPWLPGDMGKNSSFPSGHAAIAFYLFAPWFIFRRQRPRTALFFLASGLCFGILVSLTRILQGGHYLSDVLWSGGLVYLIGFFLAVILKVDRVDGIGCKNKK